MLMAVPEKSGMVKKIQVNEKTKEMCSTNLKEIVLPPGGETGVIKDGKPEQ